MNSNNDQKQKKSFYSNEEFDTLIKRMTKILSLVPGQRQVVYWPDGNGDFYGMCSSIQQAEKVYNTKMIVLISVEKQKSIVKWFSYDDFSIETFDISIEDQRVLKQAREQIVLKKEKENPFSELIVFLRGREEPNKVLAVHYPRFGEKLRKPIFPDFDKEEYITTYEIIPGRTILFVPLAHFVKSLPDFFWNLCAEIYSYLGFRILFNVPEKEAHRFKGDNIYVHLDHAVGLSELCGYVFSVRTGFLDYISSSKANITVFQPRHVSRFDKQFKISDSEGRIKTFFYDEKDFYVEKSFFLSDMYNYCCKQQFEQQDVINYLTEKSNPQMTDYKEFEKIETKKFNVFNYRFKTITEVSQAFTDIKYNLSFDDNGRLIILKLSPNFSFNDYRVDIFFYKGEKIVTSLKNIRTYIISHCLKEPGIYKAKVIVTDNYNEIQYVLLTHEIKNHEKQFISKNDINLINEPSDYLYSLFYFSKDFLIFIVNSNTQSNDENLQQSKSIKLLPSFGIKKDLKDLCNNNYVAIIDGGVCKREYSEVSTDLDIDFFFENHKCRIISSSYNMPSAEKKKKNASVLLDEVEYALNIKGLNIIVWDKKDQTIIDSVVIDTANNGPLTRLIKYPLFEIRNLKTCDKYCDYIKWLSLHRNNLLIFISSRDCHTSWLEQTRAEKKFWLDDFLIKTDLRFNFRDSWLCIIDEGNVVEEIGSQNKEVKCTFKWDDNECEMKSVGYNVHNSDKEDIFIKVNGKQLAVNKRGLNFVVWDKNKNELLDSICFDTFSSDKAYRIS